MFEKLFSLVSVSTVAVLSCFGTVLLHEGVPTAAVSGANGYAAGDALRDKNATTWETGFSSSRTWLGGTGVIYVHDANGGLAFPAVFAAESSMTNMGTSVGFNNTGTSDIGRGLYRQFVSGFAWPSSGSVYVRLLMKMEAGASTILAAGGYWGMGLVQNAFTGTSDGLKSLTADGFWFAFKNDAGTRRLVLRVCGTDYTLLDSVADGVTYVCVAKIDIGSAGADAISGYAVASGDYSKVFNYQAKAVSANLVSGAAPLAYLAVAGQYMTNGKRVKFDEIAAATMANEVIVVDDSALDWGSASLTKSGDDFALTASLLHGEGLASYILDDGVAVVTNAIGSATTNAAVTATIVASSLATDRTYVVTVLATNDSGSVSTMAAGSFYTGSLTLLKTADANEQGCVPGTVTVSRASADATALDVAYSFAGSGTNPAIGGTDYVVPSGVVTIPAGNASATILVTPKIDAGNASDTTLDVSLEPGNYTTGTAVTVTIQSFATPDGFDYWAASAGSDGLASTAANWSNGRLPGVTDVVVVDGEYSQASMTWDGGVNGLTDTVAGWTQAANFTGTNVIATTFPAADAAFTNFTVTGDFVLNGGRISHLRQTAATTAIATNYYRLRLTVGGSLTVASGAFIDVSGKGSYPVGVSNPTTGGGYGGASGGAWFVYGESYGNVREPSDVGCSVRCDGGCTAAEPYAWAGGAAWIEVAGTAILNGVVKSDGLYISGWNSSCGSGGSIYLKAASVSGTGLISANGGGAGGSNNNQCGAGGRISILLTGTDALGLSTNNITAYGESEYAKQAGCGTIVLRTPSSANGTLFIKQKPGLYDSYSYRPFRLFTTPIPAGQTWTFDSIVFDNAGILRVGPGTTLSLPGGLAVVAGHSLEGGILLDGGTLDVPNTAGTTHVLQNGPWTFQPNSNFVFNGFVNVQGKAVLGTLILSNFTNNYASCDVSVNGALTLASDGAISLVDGGLLSGTAFPATGIGAHGGQPAGSFTKDYAYDSVYRPVLPGNGGNNNHPGGGALRLVVSGALTVDGRVDAGTSATGDNGGAGSINITAGTLAGAGSIKANGSACANWAYDWTPVNGGGRVSVRLVDPGATFSDYWATNITARGVTYYGGDGTRMHSSSAGTVYLQDASQEEGYGTIRIVNTGSAYNNTLAITNVTPFPSSRWGGGSETFEKASLFVDGLAHVLVTRDFAAATMEVGSGSSVDLVGHTVAVRALRIGGVQVATGIYSVTNAIVLSAFTNTSGVAGAVIVKGDVGGFVIRICDSDIAVPDLWITNHLAAADRASDAAISNALVSAGANGLDRWQSYALGLDPDKADSVVLCDAEQNVSSASATLFARNVVPATNAAFSVSYVLEGSNDGASWTDPVLVSPANTFAVSLPSAYLFYRIRTDIVLK